MVSCLHQQSHESTVPVKTWTKKLFFQLTQGKKNMSWEAIFNFIIFLNSLQKLKFWGKSALPN